VSPNCVATVDTDGVHGAEAWAYTGEVSAAKERMKAIVAAMPRTKLVSEGPDELRFTFTSKLMRYVDDLHVVFRDGQVHYRSASRVGYGDMGVNRARVDAIAAEWNTPD
jgi:uncharacterized protein (DUF1499 family)